MEFYNQNLQILQKHDPVLAKKVEGTAIPEWIEMVHAKDGHPVIKVLSSFLHSGYRPIEEAAKYRDMDRKNDLP